MRDSARLGGTAPPMAARGSCDAGVCLPYRLSVARAPYDEVDREIYQPGSRLSHLLALIPFSGPWPRLRRAALAREAA
jgi:hypothetical protein